MSGKWRVHIPLNFVARRNIMSVGGSAVFSSVLEEPHYPSVPKSLTSSVSGALSRQVWTASCARTTTLPSSLGWQEGSGCCPVVLCASAPSHLCHLWARKPQRGFSPNRQRLCLFVGGLPSKRHRLLGAPVPEHVESWAARTQTWHRSLLSQWPASARLPL